MLGGVRPFDFFLPLLRLVGFFRVFLPRLVGIFSRLSASIGWNFLSCLRLVGFILLEGFISVSYWYLFFCLLYRYFKDFCKFAVITMSTNQIFHSCGVSYQGHSYTISAFLL